MPTERRLILSDGRVVTTQPKITEEIAEIYAHNRFFKEALKTMAISLHHLQEMPTPAATLERLNSSGDWTVEGYIHFPEDVVISAFKPKSLESYVVFRLDSKGGPVYFWVERPTKLIELDKKLKSQLSTGGRFDLLQRRMELIDELKTTIIAKCKSITLRT